MEVKRCKISSLPIIVMNNTEIPSFAVKLKEYQKWTLENLSSPFSLCHEKVCDSLTSLCAESKCNEKGNIPTGVIFLHILKLSSELKLFDMNKALSIVETLIVDIFRAAEPKECSTKAVLHEEDDLTVRNNKQCLGYAKLQYVCCICEKTENSEELFQQHLKHCHGDQINLRPVKKLLDKVDSSHENTVSVDKTLNSTGESKARPRSTEITMVDSKSSGCEDSKPVLSGSSKRKRKLPVQYITRKNARAETSHQERSELISNVKGNSTEEDFDERFSMPTKYSILEADNKKMIGVPARMSSYPAYPDVDDETPRSVEPQPRTTICYKPSPDMDFKNTNEAEKKVKTKKQVAEIVRKLQEDCESPSFSADPEKLPSDQNSSQISNFSNLDFSMEPQNSVPNVTIGQTYNLDLFRRLAGKAQVKCRDMERPQKQFAAGCGGSKAHDSDSSSAWLKWMMTTSLPQRNCLGEQLSPESARAASPQQLVNRCGACNEPFTSTEELFHHYQEAHGSSTQTTAGDQQFKVMWLKQVIPKYLTSCAGGCVSRDELLERTAGPGAVDTSDTSQWGPSCNKAVREIFPESQALRKGKFKKYAGREFVERKIDAI